MEVFTFLVILVIVYVSWGSLKKTTKKEDASIPNGGQHLSSTSDHPDLPDAHPQASESPMHVLGSAHRTSLLQPSTPIQPPEPTPTTQTDNTICFIEKAAIVNLATKHTKEEAILVDSLAWLNERWRSISHQREIGQPTEVPSWFFDNVTERQRKRLEEISPCLNSTPLTRGQAADIIGLFKPTERESDEILRFFKVPLIGMNQSRARYEATALLADPHKRQLWENRIATPMQKECYRHFNLKVPPKLTYSAAAQFLSEHKRTGSDNDWREWEAYQSIYLKLSDPQYRRDYGIKKVTISLYREAIMELKKAGHQLSDLATDPDIVIDKLLEIRPQLQRD